MKSVWVVFDRFGHVTAVADTQRLAVELCILPTDYALLCPFYEETK